MIKKILYRLYATMMFKTSADYWEDRYTSGGNSGDGSYGRDALFKATVVNDFIKKHNIKTVLEFGCGDGNQLSFFDAEQYIGFDVSKTIIRRCIDWFKDTNKSFFLYNPLCFSDNAGVFSCDATLSLDVLFHLVEKDVFEKYLYDLFSESRKYVIIYSSDYDAMQSGHEKRRKFTGWVDDNIKGFDLIDKISNPYDTRNPDFYIYERRI